MSRPKIDLGDTPGEYQKRTGVGYLGRYGAKKSKQPSPQFFKAEKPLVAPDAVAQRHLEQMKKMVGLV